VAVSRTCYSASLLRYAYAIVLPHAALAFDVSGAVRIESPTLLRLLEEQPDVAAPDLANPTSVYLLGTLRPRALRPESRPH
jgi:hypothetical protein